MRTICLRKRAQSPNEKTTPRMLMNNYVSPEAIKMFRAARELTQAELASAVGVTDKAVSKWETGRGAPDISLVDPLARALGVSVAELFTGELVVNANRSANMMRSRLYVCPICGNVVHAMGEGMFHCCGEALFPLEEEEPDDAHDLHVEVTDGRFYATLDHPMTKSHYVSFVAYVTLGRFTIEKLYPEQDVAASFPIAGAGRIYWFCNQHGLFVQKTPKVERPARVVL